MMTGTKFIFCLPFCLCSQNTKPKSLESCIADYDKVAVNLLSSYTSGLHMCRAQSPSSKLGSLFGEHISLVISKIERCLDLESQDNVTLYYQWAIRLNLFENLYGISKLIERETLSLEEQDKVYQKIVSWIFAKSAEIICLMDIQVRNVAKCGGEDTPSLYLLRKLILILACCVTDISSITEYQEGSNTGHYNFPDVQRQYMKCIEEMLEDMRKERVKGCRNFHIGDIAELQAMEELYAELFRCFKAVTESDNLFQLDMGLVRLSGILAIYQNMLLFAEIHANNGTMMDIGMQVSKGRCYSKREYTDYNCLDITVIYMYFGAHIAGSQKTITLPATFDSSQFYNIQLSHMQKEQILLKFYLSRMNTLMGSNIFSKVLTIGKNAFDLYDTPLYTTVGIWEIEGYTEFALLMRKGPENYKMICKSLLTDQFAKVMAVLLEFELQTQSNDKLCIARAQILPLLLKLEEVCDIFISETITWIHNLLLNLVFKSEIKRRITVTHHFYMLLYTFDHILRSIGRLRDALKTIRLFQTI